MYAGEIVEDAVVADTVQFAAHPYARGLLESIPRLTLAGIPNSMPGQRPYQAHCQAVHSRCGFTSDICTSETPELQTIHARDRTSGTLPQLEEVLATDFSQELQQVFHYN